MNRTVHLVTGEYPPCRGGVGDYTALLAQGLAARGCAVHVWTCGPATDREDRGVRVHARPRLFAKEGRHELEGAWRQAPGRVLLQYVPNALGSRGANLAFCRWLRHVSRRSDVRVMFHEPYFYFGWRRPWRNGLAVVQRMMAATLLRAAPIAYLSTDAWRPYLAWMAPAGTRFLVLPVPSTIPRSCDPAEAAVWRPRFAADRGRVVGHFGTYGDHMSRELKRAVPAILSAVPDARMVCIGRGGEVFAASMAAERPDLAARIDATGALDAAMAAGALRACDVVVQPYPDGVTTRRTSVMAALSNGVPVVTTSGALTERIWASSGAVSLAPAGDPHGLAAAVSGLIRDTETRTTLADRGRNTYEAEFSLAHTVDAIVADVEAGVIGQWQPS